MAKRGRGDFIIKVSFNMQFGNLQAIHYLWLVAAVILFYVWSSRTRNRAMAKFAHFDLLKELTLSLDRKKQRAKAVLLLLSLCVIVLSLMRPQWGFEWKEVKRSGLDILIAIDTSRSMLAQDVKPNRLERSKLAVKDLIKKLQGDRVGLIAFAGEAFLQCPLTADYGGFLLSLDDLDVNTIPRGGTSLSNAIRVALDSYGGGRNQYKVLVIITDGEDHEGNAAEWAEKAREQGIKIFTLGIGSREGDLIPVSDESGGRTFLKDRSGNVVKSRLDEQTLQQIALTSGGSYVKATATEFGLDLMYEEKLSKMEKREFENRMVKKFEERFQFPLALALLLLCLEPFVRERRAGVQALRKNSAIGIVILFGLLALPAFSSASSPAGDVTEGKKLYEQEKYDQAVEKFIQAMEESPDSDIVNYNLGAALYKEGRYKEAAGAFTRALVTEDKALEAKAMYNLANSRYQLGRQSAGSDPGSAIGMYRESLDYYKRAMELDEKDKDAKFNHELVEKKLKILLDQMKNQQQNNQGKDQKQEQDQDSQRTPGEKGDQQEQQQKEQGQQQQQEAGEEDGDNGEEGKQAASEGEEKDGQPSGHVKDDESEMSPEEARMLLDAYGQEEAREDVKNKGGMRMRGVVKDW